MANLLKSRRQSETSRILNNLSNANTAINVSNNEAVNTILNERFAQQNNLIKSRLLRQQNIKQINNDFINTTQGVLDDKTLDFLVQHSQIDAPTLTSLFAGFELAKASRARRLDQQRQLDINAVQVQEQIDADRVKNEALLAQSRIDQIENERKLALSDTAREADALLKATTADINALERRDELEENRIIDAGEREADRNTRLEQERIKADSRNRDSVKLARLNSLQSTSVNSEQVDDDDTTVVVSDTQVISDENVNNPLLNDVTVSDTTAVVVPPVVEEPTIDQVDLANVPGVIPPTIVDTDSVTNQTDIPPVIQDEVVEPVVDSATSDDQILFSPDVIEQIGLLNDVRGSVQINALELQQSLIDDGIDPSGLTIEEINKQFALNGAQL